jgi:ABC-2 type transport system permease protein
MTPMVQLMLFGYAINFDVRHISTVVVDMDKSRESREYVQKLQNTEYLTVTHYVATPTEAQKMLSRGDARVAIVIPPDFSMLYGTSTRPTVHVMVDGSDSQVATPARAAFQSAPSAAGGVNAGQGVDARITVLFNPQMRTQVYTIPGLVGVILQLITVSLTAFSLVRERENGSLEQLMVSPVGKLGLILGKLLPYSLLATFEFVTVLTIGHFLFNVPIHGSVVLLFVLSVPFIVAALSMGLVISTFAQNQAQALQMTMLTVMPSILLSGYIAPRDTLPGFLLVISDLLPVTFYMQIIRGIIVRGAGFTDLLAPISSLIVISFVLLAAATIRFRKSVE